MSMRDIIDLDATGPLYRGHILAQIIRSHDLGAVSAEQGIGWQGPPESTRGWARLALRVDRNIWGLSVSELDSNDLLD